MKLLASNTCVQPAIFPLRPDHRQSALVTLAVLLAHAGLLAWLQASPGPVQPPQLAVVTMELLASRPAPQPDPMPARQPRQAPRPAPKHVPSKTQPAMTPPVTQPEPSPLPATTPSAPTATTSSAASSSTATTAATPAAATTGHASTTPAPARIELPSASADYLNNPKPAYPPLSRRLREEGKVVLRVLIETDGTAAKAEIRNSSGYERLDQAALQTVLRWRYLPARRNGVPEAMWFNVPINFVLE